MTRMNAGKDFRRQSWHSNDYMCWDVYSKQFCAVLPLAPYVNLSLALSNPANGEPVALC